MVRLHYLPPSPQVYESFLPSRYAGYSIARYFATRFDYLPEEEWVALIRSGRITVNGQSVNPEYVLSLHDHIVTRMGMRREPPANRSLNVIYEDGHVRVFNKAAPIPVHPCGRYFKNSMTELLREVYPDEVPRPVQRLDALTTGVLVFAKTKQAAAVLMKEFSENRVEKEYLAIVEGVPDQKQFVIDAPIGKIKGSARATGEETIDPKQARTEVEWLATVNGRSLLKVTPRSGRTNQIRVHLASRGLPVLNDPVYGNGTDPVIDFGLHAHRMTFRCGDQVLRMVAPWPRQFAGYAAGNTWENHGDRKPEKEDRNHR